MHNSPPQVDIKMHMVMKMRVRGESDPLKPLMTKLREKPSFRLKKKKGFRHPSIQKCKKKKFKNLITTRAKINK